MATRHGATAPVGSIEEAIDDPFARRLTSTNVSTLSGAGGSASLTHLLCAGAAVTVLDLGALRRFPRLSHVDLSSNKLTSACPLPQPLPALTHLRLYSNRLDDLRFLRTSDGRSALPGLIRLDLRDNCIASIAALAPLAGCARLRELRLQNATLLSVNRSSWSLERLLANPVCSAPGYAAHVLGLCPSLELLDDVPVSEWRRFLLTGAVEGAEVATTTTATTAVATSTPGVSVAVERVKSPQPAMESPPAAVAPLSFEQVLTPSIDRAALRFFERKAAEQLKQPAQRPTGARAMLTAAVMSHSSDGLLSPLALSRVEAAVEERQAAELHQSDGFITHRGDGHPVDPASVTSTSLAGLATAGIGSASVVLKSGGGGPHQPSRGVSEDAVQTVRRRSGAARGRDGGDHRRKRSSRRHRSRHVAPDSESSSETSLSVHDDEQHSDSQPRARSASPATSTRRGGRHGDRSSSVLKSRSRSRQRTPLERRIAVLLEQAAEGLITRAAAASMSVGNATIAESGPDVSKRVPTMTASGSAESMPQHDASAAAASNVTQVTVAAGAPAVVSEDATLNQQPGAVAPDTRAPFAAPPSSATATEPNGVAASPHDAISSGAVAPAVEPAAEEASARAVVRPRHSERRDPYALSYASQAMPVERGRASSRTGEARTAAVVSTARTLAALRVDNNTLKQRLTAMRATARGLIGRDDGAVAPASAVAHAPSLPSASLIELPSSMGTADATSASLRAAVEEARAALEAERAARARDAAAAAGAAEILVAQLAAATVRARDADATAAAARVEVEQARAAEARMRVEAAAATRDAATWRERGETVAAAVAADLAAAVASGEARLSAVSAAAEDEILRVSTGANARLVAARETINARAAEVAELTAELAAARASIAASDRKIAAAEAATADAIAGTESLRASLRASYAEQDAAVRARAAEWIGRASAAESEAQATRREVVTARHEVSSARGGAGGGVTRLLDMSEGLMLCCASVHSDARVPHSADCRATAGAGDCNLGLPCQGRADRRPK